MALKQGHMLLKSQAPFGPPPILPNLMAKDAVSRGSDSEWEADGLQAQIRRTRIWEFSTKLHCSIIGTCLSTAELRHVLEKVKVNGAATASDHDLHCMGVTLASHRESGRFLQKALDHRHRTAIFRYAKVKQATGLLEVWEGPNERKSPSFSVEGKAAFRGGYSVQRNGGAGGVEILMASDGGWQQFLRPILPE
jgi:hypothetical protein